MPGQTPVLYHGVPCYSFRQLDEQAGAVKGHAFRAFKRRLGELIEGVDYFYLPAEQEGDFIKDLHRRGVIYRSSRNVVLLTESGVKKVF